LGDPVLVHKPDPKDKLAVIREVFVGERAIKKTRSQTIKVEQKLPSFITAGQFLCYVAWGAVKRAGKVMKGVCDGLAMLLPEVAATEHCPIPGSLIVWPSAIYSATPQADHEICKIERGEMHYV
jgi:hypothetical protein